MMQRTERGEIITTHNPQLKVDLPTDQEKEKIPFRIRGHRFNLFEKLLTTDALVVFDEMMHEADGLAPLNPMYWQYYMTDIMGTSDEQKNSFKASTILLFQGFKDLPPEYPVELVEGIKDDICNRAVTGEGAHCTARYTGLEGNIDRLAADSYGLDTFLQKARSLTLQLEDQITTSHTTAEFTDADPVVVRVLSTTADVVRKVLSKWNSITVSYVSEGFRVVEKNEEI